MTYDDFNAAVSGVVRVGGRGRRAGAKCEDREGLDDTGMPERVCEGRGSPWKGRRGRGVVKLKKRGEIHRCSYWQHHYGGTGLF